MFKILELNNWPQMFFNSEFFYLEFETFDKFVDWVLYEVQEWYILGSFTYNIHIFFYLNFFKLFLWFRFDVENEIYVYFFIFLLYCFHIVWGIISFFLINIYNFTGWLIKLRFIVRYLKKHPIKHKRAKMSYSVFWLIAPSIIFFMLVNWLKIMNIREYYRLNNHYDRVIAKLKRLRDFENKDDLHEVTMYNFERRRFNRRWYGIKSECAHFYYRPFKKEDFDNPNFIEELRERRDQEKKQKKK